MGNVTFAVKKYVPPVPPTPTNDFSGDSNCVAVYNVDDGAALLLDSQNSFDLSHVVAGTVNNTTYYKQGDASVECDSGTGYIGISPVNMDATWPGYLGSGNTLMSCCYWVRFTSLAVSAYQHYKGAVCQFTVGKGQWAMHSGHGSNHLPMIWMGSGNGSTYQQGISSGDPVYDNIWYHFAGTINGTTGDYRLRIWDDSIGAAMDLNGLGGDLTGTFTNTPGIILDTEDASLHIGNMTSYTHIGQIDEVVLFNRIISVAEINNIRAGTFGA